MNGRVGREDSDLLVDLVRRSPLLEELQRGRRLDRRELQERLGVSRATSHRHLKLLGELGLIEKTNNEFRLTDSGTLLTKALVQFKREARSALRLGPVSQAIEDAPIPIDIEAFAGANVTSAEHGDPYSSVARFVSLVRETDTLRGFNMDVIAPFYLIEIQQRIVDGMVTEDIALPDVVENALVGYPDKCVEACASGNLTIWLHEDLTFGLAIFDDRVGIGIPEQGARTLRVFVDTDSPDVREWAEAVYESYGSEAVRLEAYTRGEFERALANVS